MKIGLKVHWRCLMMKSNLSPEIRFRGFTDEWNNKKLGEVFEQTSEYVNPKVENLELWSLTVEKGLTPKTARYNREFLVKKEDQFKAVSENEFIYNPMNMTLGAVDLNLTGKKVAVSGYYITMKSIINYNIQYFNIWLKSPIAIKKYKSYATGSLIERQRVQFPTLAQIKALIPSLEEQTKIGEFFKQLDQLITLQQQELTILKQTKQGFLQKMFPKEGEAVPEVRFPGFKDNWKEKKLGSIVEFYSGLTYSPQNIEKEGTLVLRSSNIQNGEVVDADNVYVNSKTVNSQNVAIGDVIVVVRNGSRNLIGKHASVKQKMPNTVIGAFMTGIRAETPSFINALLDSNRFTIEINKNLGATINQITTGNFKKMMFLFPTIMEQERIGAFFEKIDQTITLGQQELEALQQTNKAFLQNMFV